MKYLYRIIYLIILLLFLISCDEEKETEILHYSTESTKLSQKITDFALGITFRPPENWDLRSTEVSKKIENRSGFRGMRGKFSFTPSYVFFDDSTTSVLSLGKVEPPDSLKGRNGVMNVYTQILNAKPGSENNETIDQFMKDGIRFSQFTIEKGSIISKRLIFQNKFEDIIQIEYTAKSDMFDSEYEKIKQSIGSISLL